MTDKTAILAEIMQYSQSKAEVPEGCVTFAEIEAELGCGHDKAQRLMRRLVAEGKYERIEIGGKTVKVAFRKVG